MIKAISSNLSLNCNILIRYKYSNFSAELVFNFEQVFKQWINKKIFTYIHAHGREDLTLYRTDFVLNVGFLIFKTQITLLYKIVII